MLERFAAGRVGAPRRSRGCTMMRVSGKATTSMAPLGRLLREVRELRRLSLGDVAKKSGISSAYVHKLEQGKVYAPSPHVLHALAHVLVVPYSKLLELAGYVVPNTTKSDVKIGPLTHALSTEQLTEREAAELARYLAWYRHRAGAE